MTRFQASIAMGKGLKVQHSCFSSHQFIEIKGDKIITEDEYDFTFMYWNNDQFKDGWYEYVTELQYA